VANRAFSRKRERALDGFALGTFILASIVFILLLYYLKTPIPISSY